MSRSAVVVIVASLFLALPAWARLPGQHEFGLTERALVQHIGQVEALISRCMREQGFEYVAVDAATIRTAMSADKVLPGVSEAEYVAKYGFGISTLYTGHAPQLAVGYHPGKMSLGRQNIQIFQNLSPAGQVAYNRALLGDHAEWTFAIALDAEDFSRCGGCTRKAVEQVFEPEQLKATYYNPADALIMRDPRMKSALRSYRTAMRNAGFDADNPDTIEVEIRQRLDEIAGGLPVAVLSPGQRDALEALQDYERELASKSFALELRLIEPVEIRIEQELYERTVE